VNWLVDIVGKLVLGLRRSESITVSRPLAQRVGSFGVRCLAQATLRTLNALGKRKFFGIVEFLLASLRVPQELEGPLVLLVVEVIQPIAQ
jgi:hypothetical protein